MPGGISNPAAGYIAFAAVKLVGYSVAAKYIARAYANTNRNAYVVGAVRTVIGMVVGAAYYHIPAASTASGPFPYLAGLFPVRLVEWWFLLWLFYDRRFQ